MRLDEDIAIVGISVYTPAGSSVGEFWDGIACGKDFITKAPADFIEKHHFEGIPNKADRFYTSRGGFTPPFKVEPIRHGIMPLIAADTDPEQLMSLTGVEQALKDAGVFEKKLSLNKGSIIIGKGSYPSPVAIRMLEIVHSSHRFSNLIKSVLPKLTDKDVEKIKEAYQHKQGRYETDIAMGMMPSLTASIVANRFDMKGPAYTIDGACTSGILAINQSIELLRNGQSEIAIAGGMHIGNSQVMLWSVYELLELISKKQEIAPFSEDADGFLLGQGYGFVVLKKLRKALADNDRIYALINETAVGSDRLSPHGMPASTTGQLCVIKEAWEKSGLNPKQVAYIEGHGSGIKTDDQIEMETLRTFFGNQTCPKAYIGSVKSNIGHLMPAAGIIGIIKTALALYHQKIPPTLHCEKPIATLLESRFAPPQKLIEWDGKKLPFIAGVNAFGFGGINTHTIMTACVLELGKRSPRPKPYLGDAYLMSAKSQKALIEKIKRGDYTDTGGSYRLVILNPNQTKIQLALTIIEKDKPWHEKADIWFTNKPLLTAGGKIVAMLPGFDFRTNADLDDLCDSLALPRFKDLIKKREAEVQASGQKELLEGWKALYIRILSKMALEKLNIEIDMYIGHSIGEWNAILFGEMVSSFPEHLKKKLETAIFNEKSGKYPLVVVSNVNRETIKDWCIEIPNLWLMSDNSPSQVMLCGDDKAMECLLKKLKDNHIFYPPIVYGLGFHTPLAKEWTTDFLALVSQIEVKESIKPIWSASTLEKISANKAQLEKLVVDQLMKPVYFRELIEKLYNEEDARIFIQLGFGSLTAFVEDTLKGKEFGVIKTTTEIRSGAQQFRRVAALLFVEGYQIDPNFLGVNPVYQVSHSIMTLPRGLRPIINFFPELDEIIANRYGDHKLQSFLTKQNNQITNFFDDNAQDAHLVRQTLRTLFEQDAPFEHQLSLKLEEHPYLYDHMIIDQPPHWKVTEDLDPVVPFTMILELFAEFAMKHAAGKKVIQLENVSAFKWLSLKAPLDIEVKGRWLQKNRLEINFVGYAKGECVLGDSYLKPTEQLSNTFHIGKKIGVISTAEFYERFGFHGPQYQATVSSDIDIYEQGLITLAKQKAGKGSLLDVMGQQLGGYLHLTQTKNTISFPVKLKSITFFEGMFDQKGLFEHTLKVTRLSDHLIHGNMLFKREGAPWALATDFVCQRFVNMAAVGGVTLMPYKHTLAQEIAPHIYYYKMDKASSSRNILSILYKRYFGVQDRQVSENLKTIKERKKHLISRIALKDAVRAFVKDQADRLLYPIEFYDTHDEFGRPFVKGHGQASQKVDTLFVSLAYVDDGAVAIASNEPVGIDMTKIEHKTEAFMKMAYSEREIALLKTLNDSEAIIRFWVAKEACAKKTGLGFQGNPQSFEVRAIDGDILTVNDVQVKTMKIDEVYIVGWTIS